MVEVSDLPDLGDLRIEVQDLPDPVVKVPQVSDLGTEVPVLGVEIPDLGTKVLRSSFQGLG